jgi:alkylation response protein AidB-like acyl-CoA dehydrogenase
MSNVARPTSANGRPRASTFERVTRQPLRLLTKFGGAELTERLGLRKPAERVLHDVAKAAAHAMSAASKPKAGTPERLRSPSEPVRFDLRPSDEQDLLRKSARRFAEDILRPAAHDADAHAAAPAAVLERAQELALAGLVVPEAFGGVAEVRSSATSALIIEELARGDMGLALAVLAPLGVVHALVDWGTREQQARWLPAFTNERFMPAALAVLEARPLFDPAKPRTGAVRSKDGGWVLHGEKSLVPLADLAEVFLVAAEIRGVGPRLFLVEKGKEGLVVEPEPAMGLRGAGLGRLRLDSVHVGADALLGGEEGALREFAFDAVVDRARIAWGAMAVGGAQAVLDYVIPYCNERKAFGEPISNRQAVAFAIADIAIELEGMRLMTMRTATLADLGKGAGPQVSRQAAMLRAFCSAKAMKAGTDGVQLLGGHGFVKDHPVERWYRDLRAIGVMEGALLA